MKVVSRTRIRVISLISTKGGGGGVGVDGADRARFCIFHVWTPAHLHTSACTEQSVRAHDTIMLSPTIAYIRMLLSACVHLQ